MHSATHTRSTRVSCYVSLRRLLRTGREAVLIARVERFLLVTPAANADTEPLRLALCKIYKEQPLREGMLVARLGEVWRESWAVDLDALGAPLLTAVPPGDEVLYGIKYFNRSRMA